MGVLIRDSKGLVLEREVPVTLLRLGTTVTGGASSVAEFDILPNTSIDGGILGANGLIVVEFKGLNQINSGSLTWRFYWGGTVRWGDAHTYTAAANNPWTARFIISGRNATGTQRVGGFIGASDSSAGSVAGQGGWQVANHQLAIPNTTDITLDSNAAQNIRFTAQFSASDAAHHVTRDVVSIIRIGE